MDREMVEVIRNELVQSWDPISIGSNPMLRNEYDTYIQGILDALRSSNAAQAVLDFLVRVEIELGLVPDFTRARVVASALVSLDKDGLERF